MDVNLGLNQVVWIKAQPTLGAPVWPTSSNLMKVIDHVKCDQEPIFFENKEWNSSLGKNPRISANGFKPGVFTLKCHMHSIGAGSTIVPDKVMESLFGKRSTPYSTVEFAPYTTLTDDSPVYFSMLVLNGLETKFVYDVVCEKGVFKWDVGSNADNLFSGQFDGEFTHMLYAGTDKLTQIEADNATTIHVVNGLRFDIGAKIVVGTSSPTGAHTISNIVGNNLTITPGLVTQQPKDAVVKGWVPGMTTLINVNHLFGQFGMFQDQVVGAGYANGFITVATLNYDNGWRADQKEKTDDGCPNRYAKGKRIITGTIDRYFRAAGTAARRETITQANKSMKLPMAFTTWASSAKDRGVFELVNCEFDEATKTGDVEQTQQLKFTAIPSSLGGDDECTATFD